MTRTGKFARFALSVALALAPLMTANATDVYTWKPGTFKLKAATSGLLATIKPTVTLTQNTVFTIPDPGASTASFVLAGGNQTFAGNNTFSGTNTFTGTTVFPLAGIRFTGTSFNTTLKALNAMGQTTTITIPDPGAATANVVLGTGTQTLGGTYTFSNALTLTSPLTAANIQTGSAKRQLMTAPLSPLTGAAVDTTVYRFTLAPGRAGTVKRINLMCQLPPTVGTDTVKVLKNGSAGNTMLSAASFDANSLTANTATNMTLTATGSDLVLTATDTIYCEYSAGTQTQDAIGVGAVVEFEPTDF